MKSVKILIQDCFHISNPLEAFPNPGECLSSFLFLIYQCAELVVSPVSASTACPSPCACNFDLADCFDISLVKRKKINFVVRRFTFAGFLLVPVFSPGTRTPVPGTRFPVPGSRFPVPGGHREPGTGDLKSTGDKSPPGTGEKYSTGDKSPAGKSPVPVRPWCPDYSRSNLFH